MEPLEIYQRVNQCETYQELQNIISLLGALNPDDSIMGTSRHFNATTMVENVELVYHRQKHPNAITRNYGLRQQLLYIMFYSSKIS